MNTNPQPSYYYPLFDLLRLVLATDVMLYHAGVLTWSQSGNLAVQVFFSLSGWLIGSILCETKTAELPKFYFNRAARIWVPYFVALVLLVGLGAWRDQPNLKWIEFAFYKTTFVYNIFGTPQIAEFVSQMPLKGTGNHFWSINAEEQFYLFAPLLLAIFARFGGRSISAWLLISAIAWQHDFYTSIIFGVLAAVIRSNYPEVFDLKLMRITGGVVAIVAALGIHAGHDYSSLAPFLAIGVVMTFAVKGKKNQIWAFLGGISYPLYLNNWIGFFAINFLLSKFGLKETSINLILGIIASYAVAIGHYIYIDKRIGVIRDSVYTEKLGHATMLTGYFLVAAGFIGHYAFFSRT
jgi:peptidoglycan/LPS O-acetylase OafA/YrhL